MIRPKWINQLILSAAYEKLSECKWYEWGKMLKLVALISLLESDID